DPVSMFLGELEHIPPNVRFAGWADESTSQIANEFLGSRGVKLNDATGKVILAASRSLVDGRSIGWIAVAADDNLHLFKPDSKAYFQIEQVHVNMIVVDQAHGYIVALTGRDWQEQLTINLLRDIPAAEQILGARRDWLAKNTNNEKTFAAGSADNSFYP